MPKSPASRAVSLFSGIALVGLGLTISAAPASADPPSTVRVVGTSDVFDSNLVTAVLKPGFEAANPQYTLSYISQGTGAAIATAEAGNADGLLVHAASLENQFVDQGYSLNNKYGRAFFWGDYVLAGPNDDPIGVGTADPNNVVGAFNKIATEGAAGHAQFVSRGGTPGTTVQEHAIWALVPGVTKCDVSAANGGGQSPSTHTGACDNPITLPAWYHVTGLTQGPNVIAANSCNFDGDSSHDDCYVFTDRGTFQYTQLETDQKQNDAPNLKILTRDNSADAPGGNTLLVNSFHGYAINPDKFPASANINTAGAVAFLDWVTSPAGQTAVGNYLANTTDGAPFIPDAAPELTTSTPPESKVAGQTLTVKGKLSNVVPGTPPLAGKTVKLMSVPTNTPGASFTEVTEAVTDSTGKYVMTYQPTQQRKYKVVSDALTQIENSDLDPVFGDMLRSQTTAFGTVHVVAALSNTKATSPTPGHIQVTGDLAPDVQGSDAHLSLYARKVGDTNPPAYVGQRNLTDGASSFSVSFSLAKGTWEYQVRYVNAGFIDPDYSALHKVKVS